MAYIKKMLTRLKGPAEFRNKFFLHFELTTVYLLVIDCRFGCGRESSPCVL